MKKCMEFKGRGPVGRPRRIWLGSVEADMSNLEINKEDVHERKKWRNNDMKRKSNPSENGVYADNISTWAQCHFA